ncbi:hypothetical protein [Thermogemmatispora carboxidivorans]|uniref:hypothetical protein n=1 Tax=Thermogemmatispora carboxidivorans TaxID=1382306 RepID=UPI00069943B5|nr:hypothetical protein [Thermogemmatispora carboxidivorans]
MLSSIVMALIFGCVLLLLVGLGLWVLRRHRRSRRAETASSRSLVVACEEQQVSVVLPVQEAMLVPFEKAQPLPGFILPPSWYRRWRMLVSLGLLLMLGLALASQGGIVRDTFRTLTATFSFFSASSTMDLQTAPHPLPDTASARIVRVNSASRSQYYTDYQWQVWSYSSCSGIALEEVMNAYGRHLIAADVLQIELQLGVWDVQLGLLKEDGIAMTANYFGFNASLSHTRTLQDIISIANSGTPVIVSIRDGYYFPGGHIFVIRGGDSQYVYTVDSSPANFTRMTYDMFTAMWRANNDFSAVVTPR